MLFKRYIHTYIHTTCYVASDTTVVCIVPHTFNVPVVGVGKYRHILSIIGPLSFLNRKHPLFKLPSGLLALCRRTICDVLLAYEMIWLSMPKEDGAGRDEANPQQARECTR